MPGQSTETSPFPLPPVTPAFKYLSYSSPSTSFLTSASLSHQTLARELFAFLGMKLPSRHCLRASYQFPAPGSPTTRVQAR